MYKHLKEEQYYIDLYDRITVDGCRDLIRSGKQTLEKTAEEQQISVEQADKIGPAVTELLLYFETGHRYQEKRETIRQWMERDRLLDHRIENAIPPRGIRCLSCGLEMKVGTTTFHGKSSATERVLFFFDCPNKCKPSRAFYEGGEEYLPEPHLCERCGKPTEELNSGFEGEHIVKTQYRCFHCGYEQEEVLDLTPKEKEVDPHFNEDRKRFCLGDKEGMAYTDWMRNAEQLKRMVDEQEQRKKDAEIYEEAAKLEKLTLFQLQERVREVLGKAGYASVQFEKPEIRKDVTVGFSMQDAKPDRVEYDSRHVAKRALDKLLLPTNWRLMGAGLSFRMGYLEGGLRGYDKEEDLVRLTKAYQKKHPDSAEE